MTSTQRGIPGAPAARTRRRRRVGLVAAFAVAATAAAVPALPASADDEPTLWGVSPSCGPDGTEVELAGEALDDEFEVRLTPPEGSGDPVTLPTGDTVGETTIDETTLDTLSMTVPAADASWPADGPVALTVEVLDEGEPIDAGPFGPTTFYLTTDDAQFAVGGTVVRDDDDTPVEAAPLGFVAVGTTVDDGFASLALSDEDGEFDFTCVPPGEYNLLAGVPTESDLQSQWFDGQILQSESAVFTIGDDGSVEVDGEPLEDPLEIRLIVPAEPVPGEPLPGVPASLAGDDRIGTALAIADADFLPVGEAPVDEDDLRIPAEGAVLVSAWAFPDGVVAGPLAFETNSPLLLTRFDHLDERVIDGLERLVPEGSDVYLIGGEMVLTAEVEAEVADLGYNPVRLAGDNRYETAVVVASEGLGNPDSVLVATGLDFADPLTAGVIASRTGAAVLLTQGDQVPEVLEDYLVVNPEIDLLAVGGPAAAALPAADSVVGANRFETATLLAEVLPPTGDMVGLSTGFEFADALAATAYTARRDGVMLLTQVNSVPLFTADYLAEAEIDTVQVFGGLLAVSDAVRRAVSEILAG